MPVKHGHSSRGRVSPTYRLYSLMLARCYSVSNSGYKKTGGAGITVCDRWRYGVRGKTGFECFLSDLGPRPSDAHTLKRLDADAHYTPKNCQWGVRIRSLPRPSVLKIRERVTVQKLKQIVQYEPHTGKFFWLARPREHFKSQSAMSISLGRRPPSSEAMTIRCGRGYLSGTIDERKYLAHVVAYALVVGEWPSKSIDHQDGNGMNNKWSNLRLAGARENSKNMAVRKDSASGVTGVYWIKADKIWGAGIKSDRAVWLGRFSTKAAAAKARKEAESRYGYHKNHGRQGVNEN